MSQETLVIMSGTCERRPGLSKQSPGLSKRSLGPCKQSPGLSKPSPGQSKQSLGPSKQSQVLSKRSPGPSKQSPGPSKQSLGLSKQSPGPSKWSPEKLKTLITSFFSFERREKKSMLQPNILHSNLQKTFKWNHTSFIFICISPIICELIPKMLYRITLGWI